MNSKYESYKKRKKTPNKMGMYIDEGRTSQNTLLQYGVR